MHTVPEAPAPPLSPTVPCVFPVDIVLEIVCRSDARTLVRCAALCKSLRGDILSPAFRIVPPCLLGYLYTYDEQNQKEPRPQALFSLVHPAAVSFSDNHMAPFLSRSAADLLGRRRRSERRSDMCVYNPMTGQRTFFPVPPDIGNHYIHGHHCYPKDLDEIYVLFTAADGIRCSFMLLVADFSGYYDSRCTIRVQTMSSDSRGTWAPITYVDDLNMSWAFLEQSRAAVVLSGGVICWLSNLDKILTNQVSTLTPGSIKLPVTKWDVKQLQIGKSPEGSLRLLVADGSTVSVWLLSSGDAWELKTVMDTEDQLRLLDPEIPPGRVNLEHRP